MPAPTLSGVGPCFYVTLLRRQQLPAPTFSGAVPCLFFWDLSWRSTHVRANCCPARARFLAGRHQMPARQLLSGAGLVPNRPSTDARAPTLSGTGPRFFGALLERQQMVASTPSNAGYIMFSVLPVDVSRCPRRPLSGAGLVPS